MIAYLLAGGGRQQAETEAFVSGVFAAVAEAHGVFRVEIVGGSRAIHIVDARREVCRCLRERGLSYPAIGRIVDRDPTSIMGLLGARQDRGRKARAVKGLTARQIEVLGAIERSIRERGYPPTLRELMAEFDVKSTNAISGHLRALERKGHIQRGAKSSRAIRILRMPAEINADGRESVRRSA